LPIAEPVNDAVLSGYLKIFVQADAGNEKGQGIKLPALIQKTENRKPETVS